MIKEYNSLTENEILKAKEFLEKVNIKEINNLRLYLLLVLLTLLMIDYCLKQQL